jgi:hypothetical protein
MLETIKNFVEHKKRKFDYTEIRENYAPENTVESLLEIIK